MARLRTTVIIYDRTKNEEVEARFVELTKHLCTAEIDDHWWGCSPGNKGGTGEEDREWCWADLVAEAENKDYWDATALQTADGRIQGAMIYRTDAKSVLTEGA